MAPVVARAGWLLLAVLLVVVPPAAVVSQEPGPSSISTAAAPRLSLPGIPKLTLIFPLAGLSTPPTPPAAYGSASSPAHPMSNTSVAFAGGRGWLVITRHEMIVAPGGVLSEAMYFPGQYSPLLCSPPGWNATQRPRYQSTARFWVDWFVSRDIGRKVWGFPKEMATFRWTNTSVSITAGGRQIFNASFSGRVLSTAASASNSSGLARWFGSVVDQGINTIAWPISLAATAAGGTAAPSDAPPVTLEAGSAAAAATTETAQAAAAVTPVPNTQPLKFRVQGYTITSLSTLEPGPVVFDLLAFTGRRRNGVGSQLALGSGLGVGLIAGSPGMFEAPVKLQC